MITYRGFSTQNRYKKFRLTDFELAKQDLVNHFNIRKGEKLMNPSFGTIIWSLLFEPLTEDIKSVIVEDINKIVKYDPRLTVDSVQVTQYEYGLQVALALTYIPTDQTSALKLDFNQGNETVSRR